LTRWALHQYHLETLLYSSLPSAATTAPILIRPTFEAGQLHGGATSISAKIVEKAMRALADKMQEFSDCPT
jgi:hypothetical protein